MSTERDLGFPEISVVAPVFNEEESVGELVQRTVESCQKLKVPFEVLLVNDGSRDRTLSLLIETSRQIPQLRVIDLFRNFGHMHALSAGLSLSRGKAVVILDGDLQDPPELIPDFFQKWKEGADVVYGLRTKRHESGWKKIATQLFYRILGKITETPIPDQGGTYSLLDRRVVDSILQMPERDRFFAGLRAWVGGKQSFVPYERPDRIHGKSRVGTGGLFDLARSALISFSKVPLRYASLLSLCFALVLFLIGVGAILIRLLTDLAIPGWATFTALLGMTGFVQSLVLAILSEYVAVIFDEVKARPSFLIRDEFAGGKSNPRAPA